ncbi:serine/threonine-protein kinase RIO3 [Elysia marginata]|uniref:non-specific serine/threonine protein kinase n=1 Tax=Elysia marginata TaxID=1093978 RepID=A0AAV4G1S4_9GAST|nr:serine/threonine-protein kinase RIO3 [Elysia marginata]
MQDAYEQTVELMKKLYHACGLVHADLSEYNLLWHDGKVWVIDVSQAVEKENPHSNDFLLRDCQNITKFFKQAGVYGVKSPEELFMDITSYSLRGEGQVFVAEAQKYLKTDYAFDYYFEQDKGDDADGPSSDSSSEGEDDDVGDGSCEASEETVDAESGLRGEDVEASGRNQETSQGSSRHKVASSLTSTGVIPGTDGQAKTEGSGTERWEISCDEGDSDGP